MSLGGGPRSLTDFARTNGETEPLPASRSAAPTDRERPAGVDEVVDEVHGLLGRCILQSGIPRCARRSPSRPPPA